jgi:hypothetical protein
MVGSLGGTTRIYLTNTHAFPAVYIGAESQKNAIIDAIIEYYGTIPNFVIFQEEGKYWLAADPAGSSPYIRFYFQGNKRNSRNRYY